MRERYEEAGLTLDWSTPVSGGSLGEYAKEQALSDAALYATVENWAEDWGCSLTDEEREALTSDPETEALWCVSEVQGRELAEVGALYAKLCERYINGEAPLPIALPEGLFLDRILVSNDRENARETIETLFSELNGAEDQQAVFTSLAAAWDDPAGPRQVSPGDWPTPLEEAAQALEPGQISGILASEEGYSILRRLPDQTPANGTPEAFDALLQAAAEQAWTASGRRKVRQGDGKYAGFVKLLTKLEKLWDWALTGRKILSIMTVVRRRNPVCQKISKAPDASMTFVQSGFVCRK